DVNKEFEMGEALAGASGNTTSTLSKLVERTNPAYGKHMQNLVGLFGDGENATQPAATSIPNVQLNQSVVELYTGYVGQEFPLALTAGTDAATGTKAQPKLAKPVVDITTLNPTIAGCGSVVAANSEGQISDTMQ
nr:outer membrane protein - Chlamydia trachomatis (serotype G) (fragments) [Chlamydia trachomatis]